MNSEKRMETEYYVVDILHIFKKLWQKVWIIILSSMLLAVLAFTYSSFFITPQYSSSVMLYVNNSSISIGSTSLSISSSEISAAQSLVRTYMVILNNRTTLEQVIEKTGVDYSYEQIKGMISSEQVNETEVFRITITSGDPYEAQKIANGITEVLPQRVADIIDGSSVRVVDKAVADVQKVSPSITRWTIVGFMIGFIISCVIIIVITMMDDAIHDEDYLINNYEAPILAKVPNLLIKGEKEYKHYSYYSKNTNKKNNGESEAR